MVAWRVVILAVLAGPLLIAGGCARWCRGGSQAGPTRVGMYHHHDVWGAPPSVVQVAEKPDRGDRHARAAPGEDHARPAADRGARYGPSANNDPGSRQRTRD